MSAPRRPWTHEVLAAVLLAAVTVALSYAAYRAMYSSFESYDDEGYMLISLRSFFHGGALYDQVYAQYGPGYFVLLGGIMHLLGVAFTNDGARAVNLVDWLGSGLLIGLILLRLTRNILIAVSGLLLSYLVLVVTTYEPLLAGNEIVLLLSALVAAAVFLLPSRPAATFAAIGALGAAVLSLKVNIGTLAFASVGFACVTSARGLWSRGAIRVAAAVIFVAIPLVLIAQSYDHLGFVRHAVVVSIGALALALVCLRLPPVSLPERSHVVWLLIGAAVVLVFVAAVVLLGGTSVGGLVWGVLIDPSKMATRSRSPLPISNYAPLWSLAGLAGAVAVRRWLSGGRSLAARQLAWSGLLRVAVGIGIWLSLAQPLISIAVSPIAIGVSASLIWVAAIPRSCSEAPHIGFLRRLIPALAVLQLMHAYPVPGSQIGWSELLLVLVGGICLSDGVAELTKSVDAASPSFASRRWLASLGVVAFGVWLCLVPVQQEVSRSLHTYNNDLGLGLPGGERMRLPYRQVFALRRLVLNLEHHCATFLSIPGINSLYLFSDKQPPTLLNMSDWMFFFDAKQQQEIVDAAKRVHPLCVVRDQKELAAWAGPRPVPQLPLVRFIERRFREARHIGEYQLLVER